MHNTDSWNLIKLTRPLEIIESAIYTGRLLNSNPVSLILVASPESAKSQLLLHFKQTKTLRYFSSITSKPLLELRPEIEAGTITHLVLPDLIAVSAHQPKVTFRLFAYLAVLMEEGGIEFADAVNKIQFNSQSRLGLLAATTPSYYHDQRTVWNRTGLLSRFVSVNFSYSDTTVKEIHDAIQSGFNVPDGKCMNLPDKKVDVVIGGRESEAIRSMAIGLASKYMTYGFRYHRSLRALARGRALSQGRHAVNSDDVAVVQSWLPLLDDSNPCIL